MIKKSLPELITGERIVLKKHSLVLAEKMFRSVDQDRERLGRFLPWVSLTKSVQDEVNFIQMTLEKWDSCELFDYGVFRKEGDVYLGNVGVHTIDWKSDCCELGYWIFGEFEGKGYISDAVTSLTNACFELGFNRVEIRCDANNERSANVPRILGFRIEACLKQNAMTPQGVYRDTLVFARLRSEGQVSALTESKPGSRPECIKHYSEVMSPEEGCYKGSDEPLSAGAPLGKATGLKKIGVHHELLKPGRRTSWPHAESHEEEFVYVVSGYPSAWINGHLYPLKPGDAVGFPSGTGVAHTFINNSEFDSVLLVVGESNKDENKCIYPLHPERNKEIGDFLWKDCPPQILGPHDGLPDRLKERMS